MKYIFVLIVACMLITGCSDHNDKYKDESSLKADSDKGLPTSEFSRKDLLAAETALSSGILINDPQYDWRNLSGSVQWDKPDNPVAYPWPFTDWKSIQIGADEKYLYMKFTFWGDFPSKVAQYDGDSLKGIGCKATIDEKDLITVDMMYMYDDDRILDTPQVGLNSMINPIGEDEHRETLYKTMTGEGLAYAGDDYLLAAFPLHVLNRTLGDPLDLNLELESGSTKYHHESIDLIQEKGKFSSIVRYKIGSNSYTVIQRQEEIKK